MVIPIVPPICYGQSVEIPGIGKIVGGGDLRENSVWDELKGALQGLLDRDSELILFGPRHGGARRSEKHASRRQLAKAYNKKNIDTIYCHGLEDPKVSQWIDLALRGQTRKFPLHSWNSIDCDPGSKRCTRIFLTSPVVNRLDHQGELGIFQTFEMSNFPQLCKIRDGDCNDSAPWVKLTLHLHIRQTENAPQVVITVSSPIESGSIVKAKMITKVIT